MPRRLLQNVRVVVADAVDATFPWSSRSQTHDLYGKCCGRESLCWVDEDVLEQPRAQSGSQPPQTG